MTSGCLIWSWEDWAAFPFSLNLSLSLSQLKELRSGCLWGLRTGKQRRGYRRRRRSSGGSSYRVNRNQRLHLNGYLTMIMRSDRGAAARYRGSDRKPAGYPGFEQAFDGYEVRSEMLCEICGIYGISAQDSYRYEVEEKLKLTIERFSKQLADEQAARSEAERLARESQKQSNEEIRKLKEKLNVTQLEAKRLARESQKESNEEIRKLREKLNVTQLEAKTLAGKSQKESDEEIQKLKEKLNKTRLEAEMLGGKSRQSDKEIQNLKAQLNETRKQSEEFRRHVAEQQKCAIL